MTMREIANEIAKREAGKSSVSVGNVREVLSHLSDLFTENPEAIAALISNGSKRKARKP